MNPNIKDSTEVKWQVRDVYAQYGRAMYFAQWVETGLASIIAALISVKTPHTDADDYVRVLGTEFEKTLRRLTKHLEAHMEVPQDLRDSLERALRTRDFLAHGFFRKRGSLFQSVRGREAMAAELTRYAEELRVVNETLKVTMKAILARQGLTEKDVEAVRESLLRTLVGTGEQ